MSTAHMFNPCSLGRWQFVNSLFNSELLEQKPPAHICFPNADRNESKETLHSHVAILRTAQLVGLGQLALSEWWGLPS